MFLDNDAIKSIVKMSASAGRGERSEAGQQTLGYLIDTLTNLDADFPVVWDTGHNFGNDPVEWEEHEGFEFDGYSHPPHTSARSETAYPSSYRGYYSDCTFNCSTEYERSTVGHVLALAESALGKSFDGYKGGVNEFGRSTPVWGGSSSHSSTGDHQFLCSVELVDGVVILRTVKEEW